MAAKRKMNPKVNGGKLVDAIKKKSDSAFSKKRAANKALLPKPKPGKGRP